MSMMNSTVGWGSVGGMLYTAWDAFKSSSTAEAGKKLTWQMCPNMNKGLLVLEGLTALFVAGIAAKYALEKNDIAGAAIAGNNNIKARNESIAAMNGGFGAVAGFMSGLFLAAKVFNPRGWSMMIAGHGIATALSVLGYLGGDYFTRLFQKDA